MAPHGANVPGETTATVVGWGMLSHTGPRPDILQEITFKTWDNQRCSSTYGSNAPGGITDHMLCAGQQGQDSCMVRPHAEIFYLVVDQIASNLTLIFLILNSKLASMVFTIFRETVVALWFELEVTHMSK